MSRRGYIDWLRGVAVLIMIEAHTIDAWTHSASRATPAFGLGGVLGGFAAPLFLFLAGVAVPLAIGAKIRKGASLADASRAVQRRGWEVFGLALLFRLQARILGGGSWRSLLKVDILNIMGPAIVIAAVIVGVTTTRRRRLAVLGLLAAFATLATPPVRSVQWLTGLPDFLEAYIRPVPPLTNFTLFPWAGFVLAGAFAGVILEPLRDEAGERRANVWFGVGGLALIGAGYVGSLLPSPYAASYFWTSSPAFYALRVGILTVLLPLAFLWARRPTGRRWSPLQQFGRTSLFVYWIHVEMAYGWLSQPLHRGLTLVQWALAYVLFVGFLLLLSVAKDTIVARWRTRGRPAPPVPAAAGG